MTRKIRSTIALTAATAVASMGMASVAEASSLPIKAQTGGVFGTLKGSGKCQNGRTITVFNAKTKKKVGSDIAQPNGDGSMYSVNNLKSGKYFAKAGKKNGCSALTSKTVSVKA